VINRREFKLSDLVLYKYKCVKCDVESQDFVLRDNMTPGICRRDICRVCSQDRSIFHPLPNRSSFPMDCYPCLEDVFMISELFSKISLYCGRFVTMMCVSKNWSNAQKWMISHYLIPKYYYTDAQKNWDEEPSHSGSDNFDDPEIALECNVLRFIELPVDFFRAYGDIVGISLNEVTCEDYKIKIDFIYQLGPPRFDLGCLILDYYHPNELKPLIHLLPWHDNVDMASSARVFYCYMNHMIDDYLVDNCYIPRAKLKDYKDRNLSKYDPFICSIQSLGEYSKNFWWFDRDKFNIFEKMARQVYLKFVEMVDTDNLCEVFDPFEVDNNNLDEIFDPFGVVDVMEGVDDY